MYGPLGESTKQTYDRISALVKEMIKQASDTKLVGGAITRESWFSWPVAVLIMLLGICLVLAWRLMPWLPRLAPQLARKLGLRQSADDIRQQFFKHCLRLLRKAGFQRGASQTVQEYTGDAANHLEQNQRWPQADQHLSLLTDAYYQVRFSNNKTLDAEMVERITNSLDEMEQSLSRRALAPFPIQALPAVPEPQSVSPGFQFKRCPQALSRRALAPVCAADSPGHNRATRNSKQVWA